MNVACFYPPRFSLNFFYKSSFPVLQELTLLIEALEP